MSDDQQKNRWWEFYAVRYAMGTVIGGVLVYGLARMTPAMLPMINNGQLDGWLLPLLAAYGLTFCYIASAPILVLHAARFRLSTADNHKFPWGTALISLIVLAALYGSFSLLTGSLYYSLAYTLSISIVVFEFILCYQFIFHSKELHSFYKTLSDARKSARPDFIDSYKHLREHGNSFAIVFFEIVLAGTVFCIISQTEGQPQSLGYVEALVSALILVWISPAVLVWLAGTLIELRMARAQP